MNKIILLTTLTLTGCHAYCNPPIKLNYASTNQHYVAKMNNIIYHYPSLRRTPGAHITCH